MTQSNPSPKNDQPARQHWRCPACHEKGSVVFEGDILKLIDRTMHAHHAQNPDCQQHGLVQLYAPDLAQSPTTQYDPTEPMHVVGVTDVMFSSWSPGDEHNGDPLTQVHILVTVPSLQAHLLIRLRTRAMCDQWIANITRHRDKVFSAQENVTANVNQQKTAIVHVDSDEGVKGTYRGVTVTVDGGDALEFRSGVFFADYVAALYALKTEGFGFVMMSSDVHDFMVLEGYDFAEDL